MRLLSLQCSVASGGKGVLVGSRYGITLSIAAVLIVLLLLGPMVPSVQAQAATPTPVPATEVATNNTPVMSPTELLPYLEWVLIFSGAIIALVLVYMAALQSRAYDIYERLASKGLAPSVRNIGAFPGQMRNLVRTTAGTTPLTVEGPAAVIVGAQSDPFTATTNNAPADDTEWAVDPPAAAAVNPTKGASVTVIATTVGAFKLTATKDTDKVTAQVAAITAPAKGASSGLPFIGEGYGTIVIAIILIAAVIILAFRGILGGEAVAGILGAFVSYIFGYGVRALSQSQKSGDDAKDNG